jgi:predicted Zn-dependent peptidase
MENNDFKIFKLKNGLKTIIENRIDSQNVHIGLIINTGSRHENNKEYGIAHLIEHLIFKGTNKHRARYILNRIDAIGGELNAYTTKEKTVIHASVHQKYFERAIDLIAEIFQLASFPENQILKEKEVIKDEIQSYRDNPYEQIYDDFEELLFAKHPLSHSILGSEKSLNSIQRNQILSFYKKYYFSSNAVLSILGAVKMNTAKNILENNFFLKKGTIRDKNQTPSFRYVPFKKVVKKSTHQAHCIMGNIAFDLKSKNRLPFILLTNILGGPAMNSRLNMNIREKYGYAYTIEAQYNAYSDAGVFAIYFGIDNKYLDKTISLILKELKFFTKNKISNTLLKSAKEQLCGQISLANDNHVSTMLANGKSLMYFNKVISYNELYKKINAITPEEILACAKNIFNEKKLSYLIYN